MATDIELLSEKARRKAALAEAGLEKSASFENLFKSMGFTCFSENLYLEQMRTWIHLCIQNHITKLFVPMILLPVISKFLNSDHININLGTIIDYPFPNLPSDLKISAIKWARTQGAKTIIVTMQSGVIRDPNIRNNFREALSTYKKNVPSRFPLYIAFNSSLLSEEEIITLARHAEMGGASGIYSIAQRKNPTILRNIALLRSATPDNIHIGIIGNIRSWQETETLGTVGAERIISSCPPHEFRYPFFPNY